jgi:hypothetical protein
MIGSLLWYARLPVDRVEGDGQSREKEKEREREKEMAKVERERERKREKQIGQRSAKNWPRPLNNCQSEWR